MLGYGVRETSTSTGATLTLSQVTGYPRFSDAFFDGQPVEYSVLNASNQPVENGIGHYAATNTLVRDYAYQKFVSATYSQPVGTPSTLAAGTYTVIATVVSQHGAASLPSLHASAPQRFVYPYPYAPSSSSNKTLTADTPMVLCGRFAVAKEVTGLGCRVTTNAGSGADRIQIGLYPVMHDGSPGNLLARTGDMLPNTTGTKTASFSSGDKLIPPGWYYIAIASSAGPAMFAFVAGGASNMLETSAMGTEVNPFNIGFAVAAALTGGWTALPTALGALSSFTSIGSDFPPMLFALVA